MNIEEAWEKALRKTEIVRARVQSLATFSNTHVPYVFLSESTINIGDTVVRKGEVVVKKPSLILPPNLPQLKGFQLEDDTSFNQENITNFFLVRGITLPSLQYDNVTASLDLYEGKLQKAIDYYLAQLQEKEDVRTGLIFGPDDCWQFSLLIFICSQAIKNLDTDIKHLFEEYKKKRNE